MMKMKKLIAMVTALMMMLASGFACAESAAETPAGTWYVCTVTVGDLSYDVSLSAEKWVFELNTDHTGTFRKTPDGETQEAGWQEDGDGNCRLALTDPDGNTAMMKMSLEDGRLVLSDGNKTFVLSRTEPQNAGIRSGVYAEYTCIVPEGSAKSADELIESAVAIIQSRLDSMEYQAATAERMGADGIRVTVPDQFDEAVLNLVSAPGRLEFRNPDNEVFMTGEMIQEASYYYNEGDHEVAFVLTEEGTKLFAEVTAASIGKTVSIYLDGELLIAPTVMSAITNGNGLINGMGSVERAMEIAAKMKAPELPVKLELAGTAVVYDPDTALELAGAVLADREDAATAVLKLGSTEYTKGDIQQAAENYLSYLASLYAMYGYQFDTTDPANIADARKVVIRELKENMALDAKAAELGLDKLTEEETEAVMTAARSSYDSDFSYVRTYLLTDTAGMDEEALMKAAEDKLTELGYPFEHYVEQATAQKIREKLQDYAVRDVTVTEEEILAEYESRVGTDKAAYEGKAGAWTEADLNGKTVYYTPAGIRRVKQILVKFREEDRSAISTAKQSGDEQALAEAQEKAYANIDGEADAILAALDAGADWQALMDEKNEDPGMNTHLKGYAVSADMTNFDPAFVEAAMAIGEPGGYSGKAKGIYGYYIIRYENDEPEGPVDLEKVRGTIAEDLLKTRQEEAYKTAVETWVEEAGIEDNTGTSGD